MRTSFTEQADFYVAALPVEVMRLLVSDELAQAEPRLAGLHRLRTRWMNGIMFYLDRDVPLVHGHTVYIDSPWALTSISQAQFWPGVELEEMGDGRVEGILSVDVSDWEAPGIVHGKQAMYCSEDEVREEVWAQLEAGLEDAGIDVLAEANVVASFLDPAIVYPNPTAATNLEPLLINTAGSWEDRPEAVTAVDNLFLAADYVRTHTDLATMEGANEAARGPAVVADGCRSGPTGQQHDGDHEPFRINAMSQRDRARHRPPLRATAATRGRPAASSSRAR